MGMLWHGRPADVSAAIASGHGRARCHEALNGRRLRRLEEPWIRLQVFHRFLHALSDRELGAPAERADPGGVEEDEGAVADPAARAAGVVTLGAGAQLAADPVERVADPAILVRA